MIKDKAKKANSSIQSLVKMNQDDFDFWLCKPKLSVDEWSCIMIGFHPFNVTQYFSKQFSSYSSLIFHKASDLNKKLNNGSIREKVVIDEFTRCYGEDLYDLLLSHFEGLRDSSAGLSELKMLLQRYPKLKNYCCSEFKEQLDVTSSTSTNKIKESENQIDKLIIDLTTRDKIKIAVQAIGRDIKAESKALRPDDLRISLISGFDSLLWEVGLQSKGNRKNKYGDKFYKDCLRGIMEPSNIPLKKNKQK